MPKVFGGVEAFETAILIIALVVIGRVDPETTHSKPNDLDLFITFWLVPFISYIFWIFVHIGRWISIAYYTSSYFWIQVGYHRKHALGLISTELAILFIDGFIFCMQRARLLKRYRGKNACDIIKERISSHFQQDKEDSDYDEECNESGASANLLSDQIES
eukprot:1132715_1